MARGYTMIDLLVAVTLFATAAAMAVPITWASVEYSRTSGAARFVAGQLALSRMEAVRRSAFVAIRFERYDGSYRLTRYLDGNGNGVRRSDVDRQVDRLEGAPTQIEHHFSGVVFGVYEGVPAVTPGEDASDAAPVRIGPSEFLSFSPLGSATSGTMYLRGRGGHQFAVRVLGVTGRITVLRFDRQNRRWVSR